MNKISSITQKKISPSYLPSRSYDVQRFILDCSQFQHKTGWIPGLTIDEGIQLLWNHKNKL